MAKKGGTNSESWVLVLYTGGTIGMKENENGATDNVYSTTAYLSDLVPVANEFEPMLRSLWETNDPEYAKRFAHMPHPPLVLPARKGECRVVYRIKESDPLLDSSNMTIQDWINIAREIEKNYDDYDGFVILHGTDTLGYTASALSFMMENLGKSIVITGSQVPIYEIRNDAIGNLLASLIFAGNYVIPEVSVFFGDKLFRGNRTTKVASDLDRAFDSPNEGPLATFHIIIQVNAARIFTPNTIKKFSFFSHLNPNVVLLRIFPSLTAEIVEAFLKPPIQGVVLHSYGSGNMPDARTEIISALAAATARGVIIVNCTQCLKGTVRAIYGTSRALSDAGVVAGYDMTPEAALTKLSYVLSKNEWDLKEKRKMMQCNLRGELTIPSVQEDLASNFENAVANSLKFIPEKEMKQIREIFFPAAMCAAAASGDIPQLLFLEKQGANYSMANTDLRSPLHLACCEGRTEVVEHLLLQGASVHVKDRFDRMPLNEAIDNCRFDIIPILLDCGAKLSERNSRKVAEAMCKAAADGNVKLLKAYKLAGASFNLHDAAGRTPLHMAVSCGNMESVQFLTKNGASPSQKDLLGHSSLDIAQMKADDSLLKILRNT